MSGPKLKVKLSHETPTKSRGELHKQRKKELKDYLDGFSEDWIDYDESPINTIKESNKIWKKRSED